MVDGGHGNDGASASDGRVPIILVCSTDDLELADGAAAGLRSRGFDVAVMGAAEDGSKRLAEVVERFERQGLYVLCRGGQLDRDGVDRLRATLRSLEVPFGRTLTLPTAQGGARGLEERVVSVARRMVTGRFERSQMPILAEADASQPDPHAAPIDPSQAESVDLADVDRWADSLAGSRAPQIEMPPEAGFSEDVPTAIVGAPMGSGDVGLETDPQIPAAGDDYEPIDRTMVTRHHPIPEAVEREESSTPTTASAPLPDDDIDASAFSSGPNIRLIVGGGVALVLIIVLAIALSGSDDRPPEGDVVASADEGPSAADEPSDKPAKAKDPEPDPEAADPQPSADRPVDEAPQGAAEGDAAPAEPAALEDEPADEPQDEPRDAKEALEEFDLEGAERSLAHRSTVDLALLDDSPLPPSAPEDRAAIAQALEAREIRSWNAFLLAGDDAPNLVFKDAELYCKTLSAGGISGWRLPSIGELLSLSGAKLLDRKGIFWSETPGDAFGDTRIVVNAKKGSTSAVTVGWDGARPICVRVRE